MRKNIQINLKYEIEFNDMSLEDFNRYFSNLSINLI
jgi:hypothetical protein